VKIQIKTNVILTSAPIVGAIVDYAENEKVDLIAIGTRGDLNIRRCYLEA
jgi:nucleotide-binding universal stress UspA family protein